jgi:ribonuclease BN (tRNA processing enzyme)
VRVRVSFLGTGDAFNAGGACHASYLVTSSQTRFLLDCGPSALLSLKREGQSAADIDTIFISHLHGDHFAGIPFLFLDGTYEDRRTRPLTIAGPPGTEERLRDLHRAMYKELSDHCPGFPWSCVELVPGTLQTVGGVEVLPFLVPHQVNATCFGLRVSVDGKTVLYSGDTGWTEDLVRQAEDTDLFICECCYFEMRTNYHLDYPRIAEQAARFRTRRLILSHLGREVLERRAEIPYELARDGMVIDL